MFSDAPVKPEAPLAEPAPATPAAEEIVAEEPAAPANDEVDDLLGDPAVKTPEEKPAEVKPASTEDPFSEPFKTSAAGQPVREWVDNTGKFRITGKLVELLNGKVRIVKNSGKTTTVALDRLSALDCQYVGQLVAQTGKLGPVAVR